MTTGDFEISRRRISGPIHFSHKSNRLSIERQGLLPNTPDVDPSEEGRDLTGVYFYDNPYTAHDIENEYGAIKGYDAWELTNTHPYSLETDEYLPGSAQFTPSKVHPQHLKRVGHTVDGDIHWHPEEDCNG
jgi:hypothetical protein